MSPAVFFFRILIRLQRVRLRSLRFLLILAILVLNVIFLCSLLTRDKTLKSGVTVNSNLLRDRVAENGAPVRRPITLENLDETDVTIQVDVAEDVTQCSGLIWSVPNVNSRESYKWSNIANGMKDVLVFSAFLDPRTNPQIVRILALSGGFFTLNEKPIKYCQIWFRGRKEPMIVAAEYLIVPDTHSRSYAASFYNCYAESSDGLAPYAVSLVKQPCDTPNNLLKIVINDRTSPPDVEFAVCVTPLNFNYDNINQLVEMIEVNRLFGAGRFTFYNHSMGLRVDKYLESYIKEGLVRVIPWRVPVAVDVWPPDPKIEPEVHYFAQLVALNDCVYREMFRAKFVVLTDLDEIIVPAQKPRWHEALQDALVSWSRTIQLNNDRSKADSILPAAFMFHNAFFYTDWKNNNKNSAEKVLSLNLNTLLKTVRDANLNPYYDRSKCIVWTKGVSMVSVHYVMEFLNPTRMMHVQVDERIALLHHYRQMLDAEMKPQIINRRMHNFSAQIIDAVSRRHNQLGIVKV